MPKVTDVRKYFEELATKAGLSDEERKQVLATFEKPEFVKTFTDGFVPRPDYSHDLDETRNKAVKETDSKYLSWHEQEKKKFDEWQAGLDELKRYRETYGGFDGNGNGGGNGNVAGLTKEEVDKMLDARLQAVLAQRDNAMLDYTEIRERHMAEFKEPLDRKSFEAAWKEHPEWGGSLTTAWDKFMEPKRVELSKKEREDYAQKRYEEGVRDGASRKSMPTDHGPREFSPMFDRKEDVAKLNDADQERHSREAFFTGLTEKQPV